MPARNAFSSLFSFFYVQGTNDAIFSQATGIMIAREYHFADDVSFSYSYYYTPRFVCDARYFEFVRLSVFCFPAFGPSFAVRVVDVKEHLGFSQGPGFQKTVQRSFHFVEIHTPEKEKDLPAPTFGLEGNGGAPPLSESPL